MKKFPKYWGDETYPYIVWINTNNGDNYYLTSDYYYTYEISTNWSSEVYNTNWNEAKPKLNLSLRKSLKVCIYGMRAVYI